MKVKRVISFVLISCLLFTFSALSYADSTDAGPDIKSLQDSIKDLKPKLDTNVSVNNNLLKSNIDLKDIKMREIDKKCSTYTFASGNLHTSVSTAMYSQPPIPTLELLIENPDSISPEGNLTIDSLIFWVCTNIPSGDTITAMNVQGLPQNSFLAELVDSSDNIVGFATQIATPGKYRISFSYQNQNGMWTDPRTTTTYIVSTNNTPASISYLGISPSDSCDYGYGTMPRVYNFSTAYRISGVARNSRGEPCINYPIGMIEYRLTPNGTVVAGTSVAYTDENGNYSVSADHRGNPIYTGDYTWYGRVGSLYVVHTYCIMCSYITDAFNHPNGAYIISPTYYNLVTDEVF